MNGKLCVINIKFLSSLSPPRPRIEQCYSYGHSVMLNIPGPNVINENIKHVS